MSDGGNHSTTLVGDEQSGEPVPPRAFVGGIVRP
jgi:hypothetical protein